MTLRDSQTLPDEAMFFALSGASADSAALARNGALEHINHAGALFSPCSRLVGVDWLSVTSCGTPGTDSHFVCAVCYKCKLS